MSVGGSSNGWLHRGISMPLKGPGFVLARKYDQTRFGVRRLVTAIQAAAKSVDETFPGGAPLRVGDLSSPQGGRHHRHGSHRSGRDVDVIFYATDPFGRSVSGRGWLAYDRYGVARDDRDAGALVFFDTARNWHFVRTLLLDEKAQVQWIFCSQGVKSRLLRYAATHEPNRAALFRASWALHQPTKSSPHADHFHVRVACGPKQRAHGCRDRGPQWPWWGDAHEKSDQAQELLNDGVLLEAFKATEPE